MAVYIGDKKISKFSLGGVGIREAYVGNTCVYKTEIVRTYELPEITKFEYPTLDFKEGATAQPVLEFQQNWTDNYGNSGTVSEQTTPFVAEYIAYSPGGDDIGFSLGENGEVIADHKLTGGGTVNIGSVSVSVTANGLTRGAATDILQVCKPDITDPVVNLDTTIFQEVNSSSTKKVYFNIDVTWNDATSCTPEYLLSNGVKYEVVTETVNHESSSSSGTDTEYWAELPYNGGAASNTYHLYTEFTFEDPEWRATTYTDEVSSTNFLVIDSNGDFYVR